MQPRDSVLFSKDTVHFCFNLGKWVERVRAWAGGGGGAHMGLSSEAEWPEALRGWCSQMPPSSLSPTPSGWLVAVASPRGVLASRGPEPGLHVNPSSQCPRAAFLPALRPAVSSLASTSRSVNTPGLDPQGRGWHSGASGRRAADGGTRPPQAHCSPLWSTPRSGPLCLVAQTLPARGYLIPASRRPGGGRERPPRR